MDNKRVGAAELDALQTMELLERKIDAATRCAQQTPHRNEKSGRKSENKATERIDKAVSAAAERARARR